MVAQAAGERISVPDGADVVFRDRTHVLFVDGQPASRSAFVRDAGVLFEVHEADNAVAALELTTRYEYDVIATDLWIPKATGLCLIQRLLEAGSQSGFVLVTDAAQPELLVELHVLRELAEILRKPWEKEELRKVLGRAAVRSRARRDCPGSVLPPLRVLFLNNESDAVLVSQRLQQAGNCRVAHCKRLNQALRRLADEPFDLVVTDLTLPDACGLDAVTSLKRAYPDVPVVVMSNVEDASLAHQVARAGAQNYLTKSSVKSSTLSYTLACAVETQRREMELRAKALCDPLTGLANREGLLTAYRRIHARAQRSETYLSCLMLDLDLFKAINDTMGHSTGDTVLQVVAQRIQESVRQADLVARLGGDEFCVIAEVEHPTHALMIRKRLQAALQNPIMCEGSQLLATASVGVSVLSADAGGLQQLLRAADRDMYASKELRHSLPAR